MNTAARMGLYGLALAVAFGGAWAVGRGVGPLDVTPVATAHGTGQDAGHGDATGHDAGHGAAGGTAALPGLAATANGYTMLAAARPWTAGAPDVLRFRIVDAAATALTGYAVEHEKRLHLIVVRRDGAHFQHVHPELVDGTWSVPLTLPEAGDYRAYADFVPEGGAKTTLAVDLRAGGDYRPTDPVGERRTAEVDGYTVRLDGTLVAGAESPLTLTVSRGGTEVTDLQPYLGAYGHLVALRATDLAYLHVHPTGAPGDGSTTAGPRIGFDVEVPTTGRYWLYLDFRHGDTVRTAAFRLDARATAGATDGHGSPDSHGGPGDGHGHGG